MLSPPAARFAGLVAVQLVALSVGFFVVDRQRLPLVWAGCIAAAVVPWIVVCRAVLTGTRAPSLVQVLAAGVALRALAAFAPVGVLSDDIWRYVWEGRVQLQGHNPFLEAPAELAEVGTGDPVWQRLNNPETPAAYPPVGQLFLRLVASTGGGATTFRLAFLVCDLATMFLLAAWLARTGRRPALACFHALCPLVVAELCAEGHNDALAIMLMVACFAVFGRSPQARNAVAAGVLLGLAGAAKFLPLVVLPWLVRRDRRVAVPCALAFVASYIPFWHGFERVPEMFEGLVQYGARWRHNDSIFAAVIGATEWLQGQLRWLARFEAQRLSKLPLALFFVLATVWIFRREREPSHAFVLLLVPVFALAPTLHPWYVCWVVPFLAVKPLPAHFALIALVSLSYHVLARFHHGDGVWQEDPWLKLVGYVPFYGLLVFSALRARVSPVAPPPTH